MNERTILHEALALDSIYNILHWEDRILIHSHLNGKQTGLNDKIINTTEWVAKNFWSSPRMIYGHDRLLYCEDKNGTMILVEDYAKNYPIKF